MNGQGNARLATILGLGLVFVLFAADALLDIRDRDAFSWMDPYQYYGFASDLVAGTRAFNAFDLPSVFPFFLVPFLAVKDTIPAALMVNLAALALLIFAVHRLCRALEIPSFSPLAAAVVVMSPLLTGLSRSLYVEFTLTAMVSLQFALWLESEGFSRRTPSVLFALLFGLGLMTKMTYPVFFIGPFLAEAFYAAGRRRFRRLAALCSVFLVPVAAVFLVETQVFSRSLTYYETLGYTRIPVMELIGPLRTFNPVAWFFYYFIQVGKTLLFFTTPFLLLVLIRKKKDAPGPVRERLMLWAWFLAPLVLLIPQDVKEPRHVAPCVVPAVLLMVAALARVEAVRLRRILAAGLAAASLGPYLCFTNHLFSIPYFLDRPSGSGRILEAMVERDPETFLGPGRFLTALHWKYTKNIIISGFEPNMALLLTWQFHPAVVYNLDLFDTGKTADAVFIRPYEDLYFLTAFNTYNQRCGWEVYYPTLDRETVVAHGDYLLLRADRSAPWRERFPGYRLSETVETAYGAVLILSAKEATGASYRSLFARKYQRDASWSGKAIEIYDDLAMDAALRGDLEALKEIRREMASRVTSGPRRNIYWTEAYRKLKAKADAMEKKTREVGQFPETGRPP